MNEKRCCQDLFLLKKLKKPEEAEAGAEEEVSWSLFLAASYSSGVEGSISYSPSLHNSLPSTSLSMCFRTSETKKRSFDEFILSM
jgi:hypothetical protein